MFIRTQNIYSLNNPINLAILLILVQIINKNFIPPYNLGVTYGKKGKVDKAIENYDKTIELNPNYAVAYSNRGNVYTNRTYAFPLKVPLIRGI